MNSAIFQFRNNLRTIREIEVLYYHLKNTLRLPNDLSDLLRSEIVYSISALDKLIHELVKIGMIDIFCNRRVETSKYKNFTISLETQREISTTTIQPPEYWIEQEIVYKHRHLSFQDPQNIADALSLIWNEEHKWQKIASRIGIDQRTLKVQLKNIINRRNQIVHEADTDIITGTKNPITDSDTVLIVDFIEKIGEAIYEEVK